MTTQYWLVKSEPETYSFATFVKDKKTDWTGVRNYAARLNLNAMKVGDPVLFYESMGPKAVVGLAEVTKTAFPDKTADEDGWVAVELKAGKALKSPVTLGQVKDVPALKNMALLRLSRLSVQPVTAPEYKTILKLGGL
ncbi:MAG TPA: EVE domain-containing protein [Opitutaceae bacterium]